MKTIRLQPEYDCFPLWNEKGENISPETLPLSKNMKNQLMAIYYRYNSTLDWDDPGNSSGFFDAEERDEYIRFFNRVSEKLSNELAGKYNIQIRHFVPALRRMEG